MAAAVGITLTKSFVYRGQSGEEWSNRYWFDGPDPQTYNQWLAVVDDLIAIEKHCYGAPSAVVFAYGHNDNTPGAASVFSVDYRVPPLAPIGGVLPITTCGMAGDQAGLIEWKTDRRSSKGKPVYLRKYMHDGNLPALGGDLIAQNTLDAYNLFATQCATAVLGGSVYTLRSQAHSGAIVSHGGSIYVTTRTLKRRGKRP